MFDFLKSSKRKIAKLIERHNKDTEALIRLHGLERQKLFDNSQEVEAHHRHLMGLAKQRHSIEIDALRRFKARPRQCPHCNKEIRPK